MTKVQKAIRQLISIRKITERHSQPRLAVEFSEPWKSLIATILSSQTRDTVTINICENFLFRKYPSLEKLALSRVSDIERVIKPVNYHKTKARHIIETAKIILEKWKGKIPCEREKLLELPGVGRKVANVYLVHNHNSAAIGVDTHVTQTAHKLGWSKEKNPKKIEEDLEKLFPEKYWNKLNWIIVRFGQIFSKKEKEEIWKELRKIT